MVDAFRKNLVGYLKTPPIKSNFKKTIDNILAMALDSTKKPVDLNEYFNFVFPRSNTTQIAPIFIVCGDNPKEHEPQLKELCTVLNHLRCIPRVFFINGRQSFSEVISKLVSATYDKLSPTTSVEPKLNAITGPCTSRYSTEFLNEEFIGVGGFGKVFKAKSKYDNCMYAIKKITLKKDDDELTTKILSEVQFLANLNHPNVIRYHCGWVEEDLEAESIICKIQPTSELRIQEISDDEAAKFQLANQGHHLVEMPKTPITRKISSDSEAGSFASFSSEEDQGNKTNGKFWIAGDSSDNEDMEVEEESNGSSTISIKQVTERQLDRKISSPIITNNSRLVRRLFIQMELCSRTLEDYITGRNKNVVYSKFPPIDGEFNRDCMMQLLSALEYIHGRHIIHRDIKPGNIFLKPDGRKTRVLLGDFGLACVDMTDLKAEEEEEIFVKPKPRKRLLSQHSIGIGTTTYAAPEQLQSSDYGPAVDVYSAGIVLFEAYNVFLTSMEKMRHIEKLRSNRVVTEYLKEKWPTIASLVLEMTDICPSKRPTAGQLLSRLLGDESQTSKQFNEIINALKEEVSTLRAELLKEKAANASLKKKQRKAGK